MKLILNSEKTVLTCERHAPIPVSCEVRNELNGRRGGQDVTHTMPGGQPYMPRVFPKGIWTLGKPVAKTAPYTAPWFIPTNAWQMVEVWSVDRDGFYEKGTNRFVKDEGYGLHCSTSRTTLGCLRIEKVEDLEWIVKILKLEPVTLEVL